MPTADNTPPPAIVELLANRALPRTIEPATAEYAIHNEIASLLVAEALRQPNCELDTASSPVLFATALHQRSSMALAGRAIHELTNASNHLGVPFSMIKGPALAGVYQTPEARPFNDIDILVGPADVKALDAFLSRLGRSPESSAALVQLREAGREVHEVTGQLCGIEFDVHFNPFGMITPLRSPPETWMEASSHEIQMDGVNVTRPSNELHLAVCLINLVRRGGGALRFYADAARLVSARGFDWDRFDRIVSVEGLGRLTGPALQAVRDDLNIDLDRPIAKRPWWTPRIGERPNRDQLRRRSPLHVLRLRPRRSADVRDLVRWYLPNKTQRIARGT